MIRFSALGLSGAFVASVLTLAACGGSSGPGVGTAGGNPASSSGGQTSGQTGKPLDNFDPCSVVLDSDLVQAITASAGDPTALGTITASHAPVDGTLTGLPGAKACKQSWTTTDSSGRVSLGGDPVIVTFDQYSNLSMLRGARHLIVNDYQSSGAEAFIAPGDGAVPHITKDGYLFRMSGNSDTDLLKSIALGIATRL
jgi:hypothetical protein